MRRRLPSEHTLGGATRCGRCAEVLPDETLTYCTSCGVPFSKVPPTDSYFRLEERRFSEAQRIARARAFGLGVLAFLFFYAASTFLHAWTSGLNPADLSIGRKLVVHFHDVEEYPSLDRALKRDALNVALQAFEDHFGLTLDRYEVNEGPLPAPLEDAFSGRHKPELFSIWEREIFPTFQKSWLQAPSSDLHVLVTNIPISVDTKEPSIETRHLSKAKLISGLGHPSLVVVSTFRMLTEQPEYRASRFEIRGRPEQARHLGEYLLAHELGHALIGLTDFVVDKPGAPAPALRAPASVPEDTSECLMHTDEQGGFRAWESLRRRQLGKTSTCAAYTSGLEAFRLREIAIRSLQSGQREAAESAHRKAIDLARQSLLPWVAQTWARDHDHFLSLAHRWRNRLLMIQSRDD